MLALPRLLAFAQLMRLPNVFTAFADIALGAAATGLVPAYPSIFALALASSGCLYLAGMVLNDYFDRAEDAQARSFRPIPSGRVSPRTALLLGLALLIVGMYLPLFMERLAIYPDSGPYPMRVAGLLALAILLYDAWLKRTRMAPLGMGMCRALNVLLGLCAYPGFLSFAAGIPPHAFHLAGVVGVYIVGVTWFARTEETDSNRRQLAVAASVMLVSLGAALALPIHFDEGTTPWYFPYLLVGFGFYVGRPVVRAVRRPEPKLVQAAVKRSILGLVVLDAVLATAFVGLPGLLLLLLLPPALWLGKWVYST